MTLLMLIKMRDGDAEATVCFTYGGTTSAAYGGMSAFTFNGTTAFTYGGCSNQ